jgi:cytochrome c-type biogenesis protein CcmH/NrfG
MADETASGWTTSRLVLAASGAIALGALVYTLSRDDPATAPVSPSPASTVAAGSDDPEAVIRGLQDRVGANPADAKAWQLLAQAYFLSQRHADSARAYRRATELEPGNAALWSAYGEASVIASPRDPMPAEALAAFRKAHALDAKDARARYFLAVARDIGGDHKGAIEDWLALLADTPAGAPWEADLRRTIEQVGKINKRPNRDRRHPRPHTRADAGRLGPAQGRAGSDDPGHGGRPRSQAQGQSRQCRRLDHADAQPHDPGRDGQGRGGKGRSPRRQSGRSSADQGRGGDFGGSGLIAATPPR